MKMAWKQQCKDVVQRSLIKNNENGYNFKGNDCNWHRNQYKMDILKTMTLS